MDLIRSAAPKDSLREQARRPMVLAAAGGSLTALASLLVVIAIAAVGGLGAAHATAGVTDSIGSGALAWLVAGGARLSLGAGVLAFTPLAGFALLVVLAKVGAGRTPLDGTPRTQAAWVLGYALIAVIAAGVSLWGPLSPRPWSLVLPALVVPVAGLLWSAGLPEPVDEWWSEAPLALRRAAQPAILGTGAVLLVGMALVVIAVAVNAGRVGYVHSSLDAGVAGGAILVAGQLLVSPNLGLWAMGFASGVGFSTSEGVDTTWAAADSGLLPMVPVLAAQPQPGDLPWFTPLVVLLPVAIGVWIGHRSLSALPRLTATRTKAATTAMAVAGSALLVGLVDGLGGGSLGAARLADVGVSAVALSLALALTMGVGAAAVVARDWWTLRR